MQGQVASLRLRRHPFRDDLERWRENDQGQFVTVNSNRRGRSLIVFERLGQCCKHHVRIVVAQPIPLLVKLTLPLGLLTGDLLTSGLQFRIRFDDGSLLGLSPLSPFE